MLEASVLTFLSLVLGFSYIGFRRVAGYAWIVDGLATIALMWMFKGTYAGMMTGVIAGLLITFFLKGIRFFFGYETLKFRRRKGQLVPMPRWTDVPPGYQRHKASRT